MLTDPCQLATDLVAAWNAHDSTRIAAHYAPTLERADVGATRPTRGVGEARRAVERYLRAFPDLQVTVQRMIAEGDQIALFWTAQGTHTSAFLHIPPTGRFVAVQGSSLLTIRDDQVTSGLYIWDVAGLLRALGLLPDL
ncbi:MAG TPA: ester cyclase [Chloroflexota bacterium]